MKLKSTIYYALFGADHNDYNTIANTLCGVPFFGI